ncbi:MAG: DUF2007 domain-containing protein [Gammaproteobacteria bacterium]|nr:DUF2007 domain-containing protein [Gammaproteobacteria bacterium]
MTTASNTHQLTALAHNTTLANNSTMTKFVTVRAYNSPIEAYLAKGRLEVEGIPAYLAHENHVWVDWVYSQALGGVKVQVLAENAENASKILDAHDMIMENMKSLCGKLYLISTKTFAPSADLKIFVVRSLLE